jgi:hypothetical protein
MTATIHELISAAIDAEPDASAVAIADGLIARVRKVDLLPLLVEAVEHIQRHRVRNREQAAFRAVFGSRSGVVLETPSAAFRVLYADTFRLGDGRVVSWGKANVEEHRQRIALLTKLRDGIDITIARHHEAIARIEAAGVTCLAEIEDAA